MTIEEAKRILDVHISKQRTHMYKPIQIAEVLHAHRTKEAEMDLLDVNTYRTQSKAWRDIVSTRLVGRVSTSSARYQDNLFDPNAVPPNVINVLAKTNETNPGVVESYIYHRFKEHLGMIHVVSMYIMEKSHKNFNLEEFLKIFNQQAGLRKSVDKIYEIIVYSLFYSIIRYLDVAVEMKINNFDEKLFKDFNDFTKIVLGISGDHPVKTVKANVYRVGVTNAADKGLDMWSNFGPVIQVKHLALTEGLSEEVADSISADEILIVCKSAESTIIESILTQIGWRSKIQGIVTEVNLIDWYNICFTKYQDTLGKYLLDNLRREFACEFPSTIEIDSFMNEREYNLGQLNGLWKL